MRSLKAAGVGGLVLLITGVVGCVETGYGGSGARALWLSRHLNGYDWARSEFTFGQRRVYPVTVGRPEFLELRLRSKGDNLIDSVIWYDPLDKGGRPEADWDEFRSQFKAASAKVARCRWLSDWKSSANGRRVELLMLRDRSREFLDYANDLAIERWRVAGLRGSASYFLLLQNEQSNHNIGIAFGSDDNRAIVYWTAIEGDYAKLHWLDRIALGSFSGRERSGELYEQYVVIERSGEHHLRTYLWVKLRHP